MQNIAVVGATGLVGKEFLKLLKTKTNLKLFASPSSKNKKVKVSDKEFDINVLEPECFNNLDIVFFSAGGEISKRWTSKAVDAGAFVIDNSSTFRMDPEVPLIVPEVNGQILDSLKNPCIIANPNCSTIQMVVALNQIHKSFEISTIKVATYQSISGAGAKRTQDLIDMSLGYLNNKPVKEDDLAFNNIPQIGNMSQNAFSTEELKMINETKKILDPDIKVSAFCVRTPTMNGHSEVVWFTLKNKYSRQDIVKALDSSEGVKYLDEGFCTNRHASGKNEVFVSRLRQDPDDPYTWTMWVVSDNLKKGAALNGFQIANRLSHGNL